MPSQKIPETNDKIKNARNDKWIKTSNCNVAVRLFKNLKA